MDDWRDQKFDTAFNNAYHNINVRRQTDASFSIDTLNDILRTEYVRDGIIGDRSEALDISISAVIAAYETYLNEWKQELMDTTPN